MSKYNKSIPKPSEICWMSSDRNTRRETMIMPFKGVIPGGINHIGWRQNSYSYSYQIQYMVTARMIPDKQLDTGSDYTKTGWKYPNPNWSGDVNTFNKCVEPDINHRYYRYYSFAGKSLMTKGSYDKLTVTVRVRSFNKKKKQHGPWTSRKLYIKCKPDVRVHKIVALADGGIQIYLNTNGWLRGDSQVILEDVRHVGEKKKQNKKKLTDEVGAIGGEEAKNYPYAEFSGGNFNTDFHENEEIVFKNCVFRTIDGVDVSLDGTYTIDPVSAVIDEPRITIERDVDAGKITAIIAKSDSADDWDNVKAWMNCKVHDEWVRCDAFEETGTDDAKRYYYFRPPLDCELKLRVGITNNLGGKFSKTYKEKDLPKLAPILSKGRVMINYTDGTDEQPENGVFNASKVAVMNYETDYSIEARRPYEKELPQGRKKPVAFLGEGLEKVIALKGNIDATENGEYQTAAYSGYYDWLAFQEEQGIVMLRMPHGRIFYGLCTRVIIEQENEYDDSRNIQMTVEEVDI